MALRLALPVLLGRFADDALGGARTRPLTASPPPTSPRRWAAPALDLAVVWWSARVSWRVGNRLRERLAAHALRLDQAWHGRHSPGQLIERIDGDVEAMADLLRRHGRAARRQRRPGRRHAGRGHRRSTSGPALVLGGHGPRRRRGHGPAADGGGRRPRGRARGQRPALRRPRGAARRARGPAGQRRRRATPCTASTPTAPGRGTRPATPRCGATAPTRPRPSCSRVGTAVHARRRHRPAAAGRHHRRRRAHAVPLRRHAAPAARAHRRAAQGVPEGDGRRPPGLDACSPPSPAMADGPRRRRRAARRGPLAVDLDDVTFRYDPDDAEATPALRGVDLHLAAGTHLGVVGRTGSGKTTIGRLLARFWDVTPAAARSASAASTCATSTLDALRRPRRGRHPGRRAVPRHRCATTSRSSAAATSPTTTCGPCSTTSGSASGSRRSPTASTPGSSGSHGLSAGEAQLLAFARAFLADPGVVVLDEASSRLDPATERRITRATERLLAGRTAVVIAHRLATLDRVDEIAVLERRPGGRARPPGGPGRRPGQPLRPPAQRGAGRRTRRTPIETASRRRRPHVDDGPRRCPHDPRPGRPGTRHSARGARSTTASRSAWPATSRSPT